MGLWVHKDQKDQPASPDHTVGMDNLAVLERRDLQEIRAYQDRLEILDPLDREEKEVCKALQVTMDVTEPMD